ncbi:hypothetical protein GCM10027091_07140 [Streptomyces daliensis]
MNELTASPTGAPSLARRAVTATTPVVNRPAMDRKRRAATGVAADAGVAVGVAADAGAAGAASEVWDVGEVTVEDMSPDSGRPAPPASAQTTYWSRQQTHREIAPEHGNRPGNRP